ncbi:hypothetical protein H6F43_09395 [Leptolyngbya sp. FACHB-36]|uniref:hypothetical protein n=1 Tax=Leptolyngbya sp. FACHB-36 TaxID=2692808 RepID=UPI0016801BBB|nr:hypothetical protein [Leptolyngbya sp. FACHB-36]MBD2020401.1 hypothetical protein [Leptolyngbya sp. FACHB-36]
MSRRIFAALTLSALSLGCFTDLALAHCGMGRLEAPTTKAYDPPDVGGPAETKATGTR